MAIQEKDILLRTLDENGNAVIGLPITRLANIEADTDIKDDPKDNDFIPIIDIDDNKQMKMASLSEITDINNRAPTYIKANALTEMTNGEKVSTAFGKISKAVSDLISHLTDSVKHVTSAERTAWNGKAAGSHTHTASQISGLPASLPADGGNADTVGGYKPEQIVQGNPNLLDNWDFKINQRGQDSYTTKGYTVDRWYLSGNGVNVSPKEGYLHVEIAGDSTSQLGANVPMTQIIEPILFENEQPVTLTVLLRGDCRMQICITTDQRNIESGWKSYGTADWQPFTLSMTLAAGERLTNVRLFQFYKTVYGGHHMDFKAVKLELGSTQTLCHLDANNEWVLTDPPPNHDLEPLKCMRYFQILDYMYDSDSAGYSTGVMWHIPLSVPMRVAPTVILPDITTSTNDIVGTAIINGRSSGWSWGRYSGATTTGLQLQLINSVANDHTLDNAAILFLNNHPVQLNADL
ncbi:MAG: hypothetical protein NC452_15195 [Eubacterium sp.]|nr:hypothetical protein [Eubacterium sp.]